MKTLMVFRRAAAALVIAMSAAACAETATQPGTIADPVTTQAALSAVDSAFAAPAAAAFGILGQFIGPTGLSTAATMVTATAPQPPSAEQTPQTFGTDRLGDLRQLASLSPTAPQGPIIPDALYGSVFTWDPAVGHYVRSATTGGPANGVRFILYAVNPLTHTIAEPLTEVGYVDLQDESSPTSLALHILVKGLEGAPTYLDYLVTVTIGAGQVTATVSGFVSNGASGGDNKTLTYDVTAALTLTSADVNASFSLNNPAVTIQLHMTSTRSISGETVTLDFTITHPGETIQLLGSLTKTGHELDTLNVEVQVNGQVFATAAGNAQSVTFYDKDGNVITDSEQQHQVLEVLHHLAEMAEHVIDFIEDLFQPAEHFLLG